MLDIKKLIWDKWNIAHIARHEVIPDEVEFACHNDPLVQKGKKGRLLIIGQTSKQRWLTVILDAEEEKGIYYPVTARTASKKERKIYLSEKGGESK